MTQNMSGRHFADEILYLTAASILSCFTLGNAKNEDGTEIPVADKHFVNAVTRWVVHRCILRL